MASSSSKTILDFRSAPKTIFVIYGDVTDKGKTAEFVFQFDSKTDFPVKKGKPLDGEMTTTFSANSFCVEWTVGGKARYKCRVSGLPSPVSDTPTLKLDTGFIKVIVPKDKGAKWAIDTKKNLTLLKDTVEV